MWGPIKSVLIISGTLVPQGQTGQKSGLARWCWAFEARRVVS
jgi:hypothetical protein